MAMPTEMTPENVTATREPTQPSSQRESMSAAYARISINATCNNAMSPVIAAPNSSPKDLCRMNVSSTPGTPAWNKSRSFCSNSSPRSSISSPSTTVWCTLVRKPIRSADAEVTFPSVSLTAPPMVPSRLRGWPVARFLYADAPPLTTATISSRVS